MKSNDNLKETDIKNRTCYYFDNIIKIEGFDLNNSLIDEKSYKNILVYNILYKSLIAYDGTRYLVLFGSEKNDAIDDSDRHLTSIKSGMKYIISHNMQQLK